MTENLTGMTEAQLEAMTERLDAAARAILVPVRLAIAEAFTDDPRIAYVTEPDESCYASSRYDAGANFVVAFTDRIGEFDTLMDVRCELPSSEEYEGDMQGWSFGFASTWEGGCIGPGGTYCNYTPDVWTHEADEIEQRLGLLRDGADEFAVAVVDAICERLA